LARALRLTIGERGTTAGAVRGNRAYVTGANLAGNDPNLLLAELQRRWRASARAT
jgi:hypothetical protein